MAKDLLPIGSIVLLRDGKKRLMIYGVKQAGKDDPKKEYDYLAVLYPEGNIAQEFQFMFNHEDIEQIVFRGYEDEERTKFIEKLSEVYSDLK